MHRIEPHALFQSAVWMGFEVKEEEAIERLVKAWKIAKERNNATEIRDVRLVISQVKLVQKKPDEALKSFNELENEDPTDIRIVFFCLVSTLNFVMNYDAMNAKEMIHI
ncbi:hypothetical protein POM88_027460 [Heracleum sosnowskyi]|uniref:Uncharacterized protein n=1 Tax=Heracleum sosnowskyi TaxID=360622 RepID=A0AAD8MPI9_9APIA|nr:hypothetical protein POM88_027460 [Heracleum sosnowskyi]